ETSITLPQVSFEDIVAPIKNHHLVIAAKEHRRALAAQLQQCFHYLAGCWPSIDVIPKENNSIFSVRLDMSQKADECLVTTMYVSDGQGAHSGFVRLAFREAAYHFYCGENEIQASLISSASVGATPTPATKFG